MHQSRRPVLVGILLAAGVHVSAQEAPAPVPDASQQNLSDLLERLKAQEQRLKELKAQAAKLTSNPAASTPDAATPLSPSVTNSAPPPAEGAPPAVAATVESTPTPTPQN